MVLEHDNQAFEDENDSTLAITQDDNIDITIVESGEVLNSIPSEMVPSNTSVAEESGSEETSFNGTLQGPQVMVTGESGASNVSPEQNGGVNNKGFVPDEKKSIVDEESKKSFLHTNGTKDANGHAEKNDDKADDIKDDDHFDLDNQCGFGSCQPTVMQKCRHMACFTACYSLTGLVTSALSIYISSQITTLEKHFNFSSSVSGFIMSCNDLGYLTTTLFFSYMTRRCHIPRMLAASTILYGLSGLMCTLAFFGTRHQISSPPKHGNGSNLDEKTSFAQMCDNTTTSVNATCEEISERAKSAFEVSDDWRTGAIFILALGMILQGVAKSPRQSFLGTYVDDNVPKTKTTFYLGIMVGLSIFGPAVAFTLGGVFSTMYITLEETTMSTRDPRWLGAWWLGFLMFGSAGLIIGLPLFFFPKRMKRKKDLEDIKRKEKVNKLGKSKLCHETLGFFKSVFRLALNPVYMCVIFGTGFNIMGVAGMLSFLPKYLETQFTIPAWQANIMLGAMNVFAACLGTMLGGCLTSRYKISPLNCLKVILGCLAISTVLMCLMFVIGCSQPVIETGLSSPSSGSCVKSCNCEQQNFFPVCGADGRNYFSPCHAGCSNLDSSDNFINCTCLEGNTTKTATGGLCEPDCGSLYPYMTLTFIMAFINTFQIMPSFVVSVRSVKEVDKPLSIGLSAFVGTLLGWFPGPVVFGALIDTTCLIWKTTCTSVGACSLYNIEQFRLRYYGLMLGLRGVTVILFGIAFLIAACSKTNVFQPHTDGEVDIKIKTPNGSFKEKNKEQSVKT